MKMMNIALVDIPTWLFGSDFYINLDGTEQDSTIQIPTSAYRLTCEGINSCEDFASVIEVMRFWGVRSVPRSVLCYCYENGSIAWRVLFADYLSLDTRLIGTVLTSPDIWDSPGKVPMIVVACTGRSEIIDFWFEKNGPDDNTKESREAIAVASQFGRLDLVQALRERGFPWDYYTSNTARMFRALPCLKDIFDGCPWNEYATTAAAQYGHLDCLKYLHENGCDWDQATTLYAAKHGHVDCLRYAIENSCSFNKDQLLDCAAASDHADCIAYLYGELGWTDLSGASLLQIAFNSARLPIVKYLVDQGCLERFGFVLRTYETRSDESYDAELLECIKYAVAHGWDDIINMYRYIHYCNERYNRYDSTLHLSLCAAYAEAEQWGLKVNEKLAQHASNH